MKADFSGYATKAGLKCSDGRTIMPEAFKHMDGMTVPLVWQHGHGNPENVLGHAVLEARPDGVYAHGFFNDTKAGLNAKKLVVHKDIRALSIFANKLVERSQQVFHGVIREVSLVLSGANPGAFIDNISIAHGDGTTEILDDEAVIYTGLEIQHSDIVISSKDEEVDDEVLEHDGDSTLKEIFETLSEEQKTVVTYMIGEALKSSTKAEHSGTAGSPDSTEDETSDDDLNHNEGITDMNVFDKNDKEEANVGAALSHDAMMSIVADAQRGGSLKEAVEGYALKHGIEDLDLLFPDAKAIQATPEWDKRRTEWVSGVLSGVRKSPFSRIKTRSADITHDDARAKGYIKGTLKKEEFFGLQQRTTGPTTIYKKQKLDRDDIIDITDFDVVMWLKGEMRLMLEEEIARAILVGDGRDVADPDKIKDPVGAAEGTGIRSILFDHELYAATVNVNIGDAESSYEEVIEAVMRARRLYKGSGNPTFYSTNPVITEMLLTKDGFGRRLYRDLGELASALRVKSIVEVEVMEDSTDLLGIMVNLTDYAIGADKGGQVAMFDDFDIDYNQYKYLIETRASGALTKIRSALVIKKTDPASVLVTPAEPAFDGSAVTITDQTGVEYYDADTETQINNVGSPYAVASGETMEVYAVPASGYHFPNNIDDSWSFTNEA